MKIALLVMAHGSPRESANEPLHRVVERLRARREYAIVEAAFLECNRPTIPEAIEACLSQGAARIDAVPYFLHPGGHVAEDLPAILREAADRHPEVEFRLAPFLGRSTLLTQILADRAQPATRS